MPRQYPIVVRKVQQVSSGSVPTAEWDEIVRPQDTGFHVTEFEPDSVGYGEVGMHVLDMPPDYVQTADGLYVPAGDAQVPDILQEDDNALITLSWQAMGATVGSSDSDAWGDSYTDGFPGQTGVNHGNAPQLSINQSRPSIGWIEVDLTRFVGWTATFGGTFTVWGSGTTTSTTLTCSYFTSATRPFVESTITASNAPGNALTSLGNQTLNANEVDQQLDWALPISDVNAMLGKWVCFKVNGGALQSLAITVRSREATNAGIRPRLVLNKLTAG